MRDVLFLSYFFPPMGGGAVLRALKFARYLPAFGWRPLVIAGTGPYQVRDEGLRAEIPAEAIVRWAGKRVSADPPRGRRRSICARAWARIATPLRRRFSFPDAYSFFMAPATRAARELSAAHPVRAVFSTAPPFSSHVVAARLAAGAGLPLVLDYRDAWADNPFQRASSPSFAARTRKLEDEVLAAAAGVVCVTEGMAAHYRGRAVGKPVIFIPNGYDEADFNDTAAAAGGPFTVVYAGQFYAGRMPWSFLEAAGRFARARHLGPGEIKIRFLGPIGPSVLGPARAYGVTVEAAGVVGHREAVAAMTAADVNLLIIGGHTGAEATLTGKIFEYLRAGRPILALAPPEGEAAALVRRFNAGVVVPPDDVTAAACALERLYDARAPRRFAFLPELTRFERRSLTAELAAFLNDVIAAS